MMFSNKLKKNPKEAESDRDFPGKNEARTVLKGLKRTG